ncbi:FecR family protein [Chondrinema litorale]|uniref:FecR family protein n=1 Tax=Chondrinema litorale TaxID=2994555 RepID=UPI0025430AA7|nr:FecR domain-containing protein [Chondrinema litorale]UZR92955.1 FecR domain-containing protein [Chondrinema litorale]
MQPEIYEHIAEYIASEATGKVPEQVRQHVENWLKQSLENQKEFELLKKSWDLSGELPATKPDVNAAWLKVSSRVSTSEKTLKKNQTAQKDFKVHSTATKKATSWFYMRAASIVFLIALGVASWLFVQSNAWLKLQNENIATTSGQTKTVTLADGTKVKLNSNSSLYYPKAFEGNTRKVLLEGEAYFDVSTDTSKPFTIHTGEVETTVLGTVFNLRYFKDESFTELLLEEGKVAFTAAGKEEIVLPGEVVQFSESTEKISKQKNSNPNILAWQTGELKFNETPINELINTLQRYYHTEFTLDNSANLDCSYTGTFNQNTLEEVLEIMQLSSSFTFKKQGNKILVTGQLCPE